jgi:REP element-mobilizing transposase RayT
MYHFYNRGAHRSLIFREPANYLFVLRKIKRYSHDFHLQVIAYCLLPNHYHFLIRQDGESRASLLPQRVFNSYTKAYNRRYGESGTLFEGQVRVKAIEAETYALNLCCYIHANPVLHGIVRDPASWPYSNYREWIGYRPGTLLAREFVTTYYPDTKLYRAAVEAYIAEHAALDELEETIP